jgi:hypothetical protein
MERMKTTGFLGVMRMEGPLCHVRYVRKVAVIGEFNRTSDKLRSR